MPETLKVAHHNVYHPGRSGMHETVKEIVMAERAMGIEAQFLCPNDRDGGKPVMHMVDVHRFHANAGPPCPRCNGEGIDPQPQGTQKVRCKECNGGGKIEIPIPRYPSDIYTQGNSQLCTASYDWAIREADVHVMHWKGDNMTEKLKPLVFASHGSYPEYCLSTELFNQNMGAPFTGTIQRLKDADATIAFTKRQEWFLKQLSAGEVHYVPFGIDIFRYRPRGPRIKDMEGKPVCGYLEQWRDFKLPDTYMHAIKYASESLPEISMCIAGAEQDPHLFNKLATELNIDHRFTPADSVMGHITYPEQFMRSFHIFFNPVLTGESSRTGREALSCGTPAFAYKGRWTETDSNGNDPYFARADLFDPISIGECICKLWDKMKDDEKKLRAEARLRATKTWDIRATANAIVHILQDVTQRYDIDLSEYKTEMS